MPDGSAIRAIIAKWSKYYKAVRIWQKYGGLRRSQSQINHIYYNHCKPCEHFNDDTCELCGCNVNTNTFGALNKIAMATEECPIKKWLRTKKAQAVMNGEITLQCGGCVPRKKFRKKKDD